MPRKAKRPSRHDAAVRERCKALIAKTVKTFTGTLNAKAIVSRIELHHRAKVEKDRPLLLFLWKQGLEPEVRAALHEWGLIGIGDDDPPQLNLFPEREWPLVKRIGKARIWIPSRKAHEPYHDLTPDDLVESRRYYLAHGKHELAAGAALLELAAMRPGSSSATAAA